MKIARLIFFLVYNGYSRSRDSTSAYFAASTLLTGLFGFNLFVIFRWLNLTQAINFIGAGGNYGRLEGILRIVVTTLIPGHLIFRAIIPESNLQNQQYTPLVKKQGRIIFISYIALTVLALLVTRILKEP